jgi:hypothetical protein
MDAETRQGALNVQVADLVTVCHGIWSGESGIQVWFQDGCATALSHFGLAGLDVGCVTNRLNGERWQCAVGLQCGGGAITTLR